VVIEESESQLSAKAKELMICIFAIVANISNICVFSANSAVMLKTAASLLNNGRKPAEFQRKIKRLEIQGYSDSEAWIKASDTAVYNISRRASA
jgi:hypothetical protein